MQPIDYQNFKAEELLTDEYFTESERHPTAESAAFWKEAQRSDARLAGEIAVARDLLRVVRQPGARLAQDEADRLWRRIEKANGRNERMLRLRYAAVAAAAVVLLVVMVGRLPLFPSQPPDIRTFAEASDTFRLEPADVQLVISSREVVAVKEDSVRIHYDPAGDISVNSRPIANAGTEIRPDKAEYNQLIVPLGRRSFVTFSDGTRVWVNAGTRLVYPASFPAGKREIYVEGEIYLEVAPDASKPFIVKTNRMQVRVLGTHFNVNAYKDEACQQIVLVEGKVEVTTGRKERRTLHPDEMLSYGDRGMSVRTVDVDNYVMWKDGYYRYEQERLSEVFKRLAKYYGKTITYEDAVGRMTCSGKLDLKNELSGVIETIRRAAPVAVRQTGNELYFYVEPLKSNTNGNLKK